VSPLSPAVRDDLARLRALLRGWLLTSGVPPRRHHEAATRFVDRRLAQRRRYVANIRERMELVLGGAARGVDLEEAARQYCRRTLEEQWGHWRTLHRGDWQVEIEVEGREHLEAAQAAGSGAILWAMSFCGYLVPKMGLDRAGARLVVLSAADHGAHYPPTRLGLSVVGPLYCAAENRYLVERVVIPADQSLGYMRTIKERLEANRNVWIAGERTARRRNVAVRILGREVRLATGSPSFAFAVGSRLLPVDVVRERPFHYRLRIDRPVSPAARDKEGFIEAAVTEYAARVEQRLLEHPADWMWEHHVVGQLLRAALHEPGLALPVPTPPTPAIPDGETR
jgi:lauroyl/myristoyl acyltransferase